jgi:hypothetical protein
MIIISRDGIPFTVTCNDGAVEIHQGTDRLNKYKNDPGVYLLIGEIIRLRGINPPLEMKGNPYERISPNQNEITL